MKKKSRTHRIDTVFVMVVFTIFAFSVLMVLTLGAGIYKNINDIVHENENEHIALSYIRTKLRNHDSAGAVCIRSINGVTALSFDETIANTEYRTLIYSYNGWLCEMFSEASADFSPGDGMRIVEVLNLHFTEQNYGIIQARAGDIYIFLSPRSGGDG